MRLVSTSLTTDVPRRWRLRFCVRRLIRWLVPAERCFALPLAVNRKRFLVALWVFCLGMSSSGCLRSILGKTVIIERIARLKRGASRCGLTITRRVNEGMRPQCHRRAHSLAFASGYLALSRPDNGGAKRSRAAPRLDATRPFRIRNRNRRCRNRRRRTARGNADTQRAAQDTPHGPLSCDRRSGTLGRNTWTSTWRYLPPPLRLR